MFTTCVCGPRSQPVVTVDVFDTREHSQCRLVPVFMAHVYGPCSRPMFTLSVFTFFTPVNTAHVHGP